MYVGAVGRQGLFKNSATVPTLMGLDCVGNETEIFSCSHTVRSSCGLLNDAHVVCQGKYFHGEYTVFRQCV